MMNSTLEQIINTTIVETKAILENADIPDKFFEKKFNKNSIFSNITNNLGFGVLISDRNNISKKEILEQTYNSLNQNLFDEANSFYIQQLDSIASGFAKEIETVFLTLKNQIKPEVRKIEKLVFNKFHTNLKKSKLENLISSEESIDTSDIRFLKWTGLSKSNVIIDNVHTFANIKKRDLTINNLNYAIGKLKLTKIEDLDLSEEAKESNTNLIRDFFNRKYESISSDLGEQYFKYIVNNRAYKSLVNNIIRKINNKKDVVIVVKDLLFLCNNVILFTDIIKNKNIELLVNEKSYNKILNNIQKVKTLCYIGLYYCLYNKKTTLKNKLILSKDLVNYDLYKKFEKNGGSLEDIANFIKAYYFDKPFSSYGVSYETVSKSDIKSDITKINIEIALQKDKILTDNLKRAFYIVMTNSFDDIYKYIVNDSEKNSDIINKVKQDYNRYVRIYKNLLKGKEENVFDAIYDIIVKSFYPKSLVEKVYFNLGNNYKKLLDKSEIHEKDIKFTNVTSTVDILIDYIMEFTS